MFLMTDDTVSDNYALVVAEKLGSVLNAVTNLGSRIDLMRDDQRTAHAELRQEQQRDHLEHDVRLNAHEERIRTIELTVDSWRERLKRTETSFQARLMFGAAVASPIASYLLFRFFG
jgi:hypothetical protein